MASILNSLKQTITGSADKAYLMLRKEVIEEEDNPHDDSGVSALTSLADTLSEGLKTVSKTASILGVNTGLAQTASKEGFIAIKVQYNPASVQFYGFRDAVEITQDNQLRDFERPSMVEMSMELIFDTMENGTSFMMDKTAADVAKGLIKKSKSVRPIVELLVAAMVFRSTRWVGFAMGDFTFWGELTSMDATYTMFNMDGDPVRAKVNISIREDSINITELTDEASQKEKATNRSNAVKGWDKQFNKLSKTKSKSSTLSNLLNI